MEITSVQKNIHTSPRKLRLVADLVRKMKPDAALQALHFTNKAAAQLLSSAIRGVLANARQRGLKTEVLTFKSLEVNEGMKLPRYRAGARGRANPYRRKMSHIKIVLEESGDKNQESAKEHQSPRKGGLGGTKS